MRVLAACLALTITALALAAWQPQAPDGSPAQPPADAPKESHG
jgi:hypothetical protein